MMRSRCSCVADANVLIDLHHGRALLVAARFFDFLVPDVIVVEELRSPGGPTLVHQGVIRMAQFSATDLMEVLVLRERYTGPSLPDLFALHLARTRGLVLLTGDGHLRRAARREGVEVHGVLWVLDGLVEARGFTPDEAAQALRRMLEAGARLPEPEWRRRLRAWMTRR